MSEHDPVSEETIFSTALYRAPAERAAYLDEVCAGQPALRERIEELIKAQPQLRGFMETPAHIGPPGAPETIPLTWPSPMASQFSVMSLMDAEVRRSPPIMKTGRLEKSVVPSSER